MITPEDGCEKSTAAAPDPGQAARHVITFAVEDYFQAGALAGVVQTRHWSRFERRVEHGTRIALELLDAAGTKATFFVLGWIAERMPELVAELARRGHEVASKGYSHRELSEMSSEAFREDLLRSCEVIERASGHRVAGYRIGRGSFGVADLWALEVLAAEGLAYDSSFYPRLRSIGSEGWRRYPFLHRSGDRGIWEVPLSSLRVAGLSVPVAGGNYFRQFPHPLARAVVDRWAARTRQPFVMHFHVWELDPDSPTISAASRLARVRQHRNVDQMRARLEDHLRRHRFGSIAEHLGIAPVPLEPARRDARAVELAPVASAEARPGSKLTVVVPCYNEALVLPYLANALDDVARGLPGHDLRFVFVDDGSTDDTWAQLQRIFGGREDCKLVQQPRNQGVAAAIMAGIAAAETEAVCSIDCDCTYDPHQLQGMLPLFRDGVDLVTASPYHRLGAVANVPAWRLFLSRTLSRMYRVVLHQRLATFTSCFRVYRRSTFERLTLAHGGFLGIAEMIGLVSLRGGTIVEYPAVLEVRLLGRSKMKIARTVVGHLGLLARFAMQRLRAARAGRGAPAATGRADRSGEHHDLGHAVRPMTTERS